MTPAFTEIRRRFCLIRENTVYPFLQTMAARKALLFFLLFILTACLLAYGGTVLRLVILALASVGIAAVLLLARRKRFWYRVLLLVFCGIMLGTVQSIVILDLYAGRMEMQAEAGVEITVQAEVMEVVYTNAYSGRYICRITGNGLPCKISLQSASTSLQVGQILTGNIRFLSWEQTDDGFDEERYYLGKGVIAAAEDLGLQNTGETRVRLTGLFQRWNRYLSDRISAHVQNDGLPLAMLLGNRNGLSDSVQRDFRRLGILHLIAVSGSHFSMLSSMMERFMIRLRIRPGHRLKLLGALTVLYMFLTGMTASVLRAGLMFLLALVCRGLEYKIRYFTALNIACGIILLADPFAALDAGLH
ncbi:MAG: ComEC/Rec2 family competence protein, partial [Clostridia bacterium]|nr:ComEC/Rec2 family competence protein [Clostridia bacterium]